jgi:FkbM family methyltransferase
VTLAHRPTRRLQLVVRLIQWLSRRTSSVEPEAAALEPFLPEGAVCCDIGAEYGLYTLTFARRPGTRVVSFEPLPGPNAFLTRMLRWLGADNVELHRHALGDAPRSGSMSLPRRRGLPVHGRAFLADEADGLGPNVEFAGEQLLPVTVSTLDAVLEERGVDRLDLIKLDVEGYEPAVLRGAARSIERFRPVLLVEIEDRHLAKFGADAAGVVEQMQAHGYGMATLVEDRWVATDRVTEAARNYLFTPDDHGRPTAP